MQAKRVKMEDDQPPPLEEAPASDMDFLRDYVASLPTLFGSGVECVDEDASADATPTRGADGWLWLLYQPGQTGQTTISGSPCPFHPRYRVISETVSKRAAASGGGDDGGGGASVLCAGDDCMVLAERTDVLIYDAGALVKWPTFQYEISGMLYRGGRLYPRTVRFRPRPEAQLPRRYVTTVLEAVGARDMRSADDEQMARAPELNAWRHWPDVYRAVVELRMPLEEAARMRPAARAHLLGEVLRRPLQPTAECLGVFLRGRGLVAPEFVPNENGITLAGTAAEPRANAHCTPLPAAVARGAERNVVAAAAALFETVAAAYRGAQHTCCALREDVLLRETRDAEQLRWLRDEVLNGVLLRHDVLRVRGTAALLPHIDDAHHAIAAVARVLHVRRRQQRLEAEAPPPPPAEHLCSEQREALYRFVHAEAPFMFVSGRGGSGKSELVKALCAQFESADEYLVCTFQARNAGALAPHVRDRAFTAHKVLARTARDPIYIASVRLLVVDEVGMMYPALLAPLLATLLLDGCLERVLFTGDQNQLPSIAPGRLALDLLDISRRAPWLCQHMEFRHCHRVDAGALQLHRGAEAVLRGAAAEVLRAVEVLEVGGDGGGGTADSSWQRRVASDAERLARAVVGWLAQQPALPIEQVQVFTRTNSVMRVLNSALSAHYLGGTSGVTYACGLKFMFKRNDYTQGVYTNRVLVLDAVFDCVAATLQPHTHPRTPAKELLAAHDSVCALPSLPDDGLLRVLRGLPRVTEQRDTRARVGAERVRVLVYHAVEDGPLPGTRHAVILNRQLRAAMRPALCCTLHAMQGGEVPVAVYVIPYNSSRETRQSLYTAVTRAQRRLLLVTGTGRAHVQRACATLEPERRSNLPETVCGDGDDETRQFYQMDFEERHHTQIQAIRNQ